MTNLLKTNEYGLKEINVNGRAFYTNRITECRRVSKSTVEGTMSNGWKFVIEGGKSCGGTSRDWFLDVEGWSTINCTSLRDALNLIENC